MTNIIEVPPGGSLTNDPAVLTRLQLWANTMPITPAYFAQFTCEGVRASGVINHLNNSQDEHGLASTNILNDCVRRQLWYYLFMVTQELEAEVHWTLSPRMVVDDLPYRPGHHSQTYYGGITDPMVAPAYEVHTDKATVVHWILKDLEPVPDGFGRYTFDLPMDKVSNPDRIMLAEQGPSDMPEIGAKLVKFDFAAPVRRVGSNWRITVDGGKFGADGGVTTARFSLYHPDYSFVYIPTSVVAGTPDNPILADAPFIVGSTSIQAVYPSTLQTVPMEYDAEETYGGVLCRRYRVAPDYVIDPVFEGDPVDLTQAEFYKFLVELDLITLGKQFAPGVIHYSDQVRYAGVEAWRYTLGYTDLDDHDGVVQSTDTTYACVEVIDAVRGFVAVKPVTLDADDDGNLVWDATGRAVMKEITACTDLPTTGRPVRVEVSYATDPYSAGLDKSSAIETLRYAIACRTAAELPLSSCDCEVDCGFIHEMRQFMDTTIYTPTGGKIVALRHGKEKGNQVFTQALDESPRIRRAAI